RDGCALIQPQRARVGVERPYRLVRSRKQFGPLGRPLCRSQGAIPPWRGVGEESRLRRVDEYYAQIQRSSSCAASGGATIACSWSPYTERRFCTAARNLRSHSSV